MTADDELSMDTPLRKRGAIAGISAVLVVGAALVDLFTPANMILPILYGIPVALMAWSGDRRWLWACAGSAVVLAMLQLAVGTPPTHEQVWAIALLNRVIAAGVILVIAGLSDVRISQQRVQWEYLSILHGQNTELEKLNEELREHEELIVRQNEELQSQTEELETQSEELRVANEELVNWERMLEQLLELSRALTIDLGRSEVMSRICEALEIFSGGLPSAILEKHGDEVEIVCHHGFGPEGPVSTRLPYARSFASLVISAGQTAFLEDAERRPDLLMPTRHHGPPLAAVLAAPLRVQGRCVGTVEIYCEQPRAWNEAEVSMVESLAAQASISTQSAELLDTIQQERRRFEAAVGTVPIAMLVADDPACREVRVNPAAAAMLNVTKDENLSPFTPLGQRVARYLVRGDHPLDPGNHPLVRAAAGVDIVNDELELVLPGGTRRALLVSASPICDADGIATGAVAALVDVTAQKLLQHELELRRREAEEAAQRKTRFLAAVSHDIRTPANAINLTAELISRYAADPKLREEIPSLAAGLQRSTLSLIELVGDVLDLARFDAGKIELTESEFSLSELIEEECRQLMPLAVQKQVALNCEPAGRPLWIRTDRVKLARVLANLIGNAIKFTDQGSIRIESAVVSQPQGLHSQPALQIRVIDSGIGIAPEHQETIFNEFAQLHNPARDRAKGTGLGLAISKRLVDLIGGTLSVESVPRQGSTFTVSLPASVVMLRLGSAVRTSKADPAMARIVSAAVSPMNLRVLLVEDHEPTRLGTARLLREEGAAVIEAADGRSALDRLQSSAAFDVLLVDMMLPDMDGREVLKAARSHDVGSAAGAVFAMTADLSQQRLDELRELGIDGLIEKPVDITKLVGTLRGLKRDG
ncbi:MAG TPA: ATP-binding protein [Pirellulales bacterium]|jgi:signal transduction histidine kinase|nr:ATP-binding protein [Pirellulales bacterium]